MRRLTMPRHRRRDAGDADLRALQNANREPRRHPRIDGVTAGLQHLEGGMGGEVMARRRRVTGGHDGGPARLGRKKAVGPIRYFFRVVGRHGRILCCWLGRSYTIASRHPGEPDAVPLDLCLAAYHHAYPTQKRQGQEPPSPRSASVEAENYGRSSPVSGRFVNLGDRGLSGVYMDGPAQTRGAAGGKMAFSGGFSV